jgi:Subtilase family
MARDEAQEPAPGQPLIGQYADYPRGSVAERRGVARQVAVLGRPASGGSWQLEFVRRLQRRRRGAPGLLPDEGIVQFETLADQQGLDLLVVDELLVRTVDYNSPAGPFRPVPMRDLLADYAFDAVPVPGLDARVTRLRSAAYGPAQLADLARVLRRAGYQASVNHVTPLGKNGPVVKGESGPVPARGLDNFQRPPDSAHRITIAVIDTGVSAEVRGDGWLSGLPAGDNIDPLNVFPIGNADQYLDFAAGHGTFVAGIVEQLAPAADLRMYRAVDSDGIGSEVQVATAMVRAVRDGARILNLSVGSQTLDDQPPLAIEVALELIGDDVLVVAAAGNSGSTRATWPAAFRRVISVASLDATLRPSLWSNRGFWVDCATVGEGILSTFVAGSEDPELDPLPDDFPADAWARWSGTSFTTPQIVGAVAGRCLLSGRSPREEAADLLAQGVPVPDFGQALEILPGL